MLRCVGRNQLVFGLSYPFLVKPFYKLSFLASAGALGLLRELRGGPVPFPELAKKFVRLEPDQGAFREWLGIGEGLGVLRQTSRGFRLKGILSRLLAREAYGPLSGLIEETVSLHHRLITDLPKRLGEGRHYGLSEHDGTITARSSTMMEPLIFNVLDRVIPKTGAVALMDVGCGGGTYLRYAMERNPELTAVGVELQADVAELARQNLERWRMSKTVTVQTADIRDLPPKAQYDFISLHSNIYYFKQDRRVALLRHLRGFLKPGGKLIITTACAGGTIPARMEGLWSSMTEGFGPYPGLQELLGQTREAGYESALSWKLVLGESFYCVQGTNPALPAKAPLPSPV